MLRASRSERLPQTLRGLGNDDFDTDENIRPRFLGGVFAFATVELVFLGATNKDVFAFAAKQLVFAALPKQTVIAALPS